MKRNSDIHPADLAYRGLLAKARFFHLKNNLVIGMFIGVLLLIISVVLQFLFFPILERISWGIAIVTVLLGARAHVVYKEANDKPWPLEAADNFIEKYNAIVRAMNMSTDSGFNSYSFNELTELARTALAYLALEVRKIEIDNAGISEEHWRVQKLRAAKQFESVHQLMQQFGLVNSQEGYRPFYERATAYLEKRSETL